MMGLGAAAGLAGEAAPDGGAGHCTTSGAGDLLRLELVHDSDRIESVCFAPLDPAESVVEKICLLANGFADDHAQERKRVA